MGFLCKIKHKWEYYSVDFDINHKIHRISKKTIWFRKCKCCGKKQQARITSGSGIYNIKLGKYCTWFSSELTKQEDREHKLNKLGL